MAWIEDVSAVVADAVTRRQEAGEERRVCRQRKRGPCDRLFEEDAFLCKPVQVRRHRIAVTVCTDPVRTGGIQRDDDNVQVAARALDALVEQPVPGDGKTQQQQDR